MCSFLFGFPLPLQSKVSFDGISLKKFGEVFAESMLALLASRLVSSRLVKREIFFAKGILSLLGR